MSDRKNLAKVKANLIKELATVVDEFHKQNPDLLIDEILLEHFTLETGLKISNLFDVVIKIQG